MLEKLNFSRNLVDIIGFTMPIIFISLIIVFLILAVILSYHWRKYGVGRLKAALFMLIYLIGGIVLVGVMAIAKLSYWNL